MIKSSEVEDQALQGAGIQSTKEDYVTVLSESDQESDFKFIPVNKDPGTDSSSESCLTQEPMLCEEQYDLLIEAVEFIGREKN